MIHGSERRPVPALAPVRQHMARHPAVRWNRPLADGLAAEATPERPLVTVVTVVFNGAATLSRCLACVREQSYGPIEHIVVDGGSTDGTVDLLREHADTLAAWMSDRDAGISDGFNRGLGLARGDIIGLLNADDWYEPDTVERVVQALVEHPSAGIACGRLRYWRGDTRDVEFPSQPERLGGDMTVNHPTMFVRREVYERIGLFLTDFGVAMDYELALRAQRAGVGFVSLDRVLANMAWGGASDTQWRRTLAEVARAVHRNHPHSLRWHGLLLFKAAKSTTARALSAVGLERVARLYRSRISHFRRRYPDPGDS